MVSIIRIYKIRSSFSFKEKITLFIAVFLQVKSPYFRAEIVLIDVVTDCSRNRELLGNCKACSDSRSAVKVDTMLRSHHRAEDCDVGFAVVEVEGVVGFAVEKDLCEVQNHPKAHCSYS